MRVADPTEKTKQKNKHMRDKLSTKMKQSNNFIFIFSMTSTIHMTFLFFNMIISLFIMSIFQDCLREILLKRRTLSAR